MSAPWMLSGGGGGPAGGCAMTAAAERAVSRVAAKRTGRSFMDVSLIDWTRNFAGSSPLSHHYLLVGGRVQVRLCDWPTYKMSCRTGPLRVARSLRDLCTFSRLG